MKQEGYTIIAGCGRLGAAIAGRLSGQNQDVLVLETVTYAHAYLLVYAVGTLALTASSGCTLIEAAFEFASSLDTVGLSIGVTSVESNALTLLIEIAGMILGRLEIFVLLQAVFKSRSD